MVLEMVIPDGSVEANVLERMGDPQGYLLGLLRADQANRLPETTRDIPDYVAIIEQAQKSPNRFKTVEEANAYLEALRSEW